MKAKECAFDFVMVVDDNQLDTFIAQRVMQLHNFATRIEVFHSPENALRYLSDRQNDVGDLPDLLFLDVNMPVIDAYDFLARFGQLSDAVRHRSKIVILSSSITRSDFDNTTANSHVVAYVQKPISAAQLGKVWQLCNDRLGVALPLGCAGI